LPGVLHRAGNPGRSCQLPHGPDRGKQPLVPAAGLGLFQFG
jgi:hypothetical protein